MLHGHDLRHDPPESTRYVLSRQVSSSRVMTNRQVIFECLRYWCMFTVHISAVQENVMIYQGQRIGVSPSIIYIMYTLESRAERTIINIACTFQTGIQSGLILTGSSWLHSDQGHCPVRIAVVVSSGWQHRDDLRRRFS